MPITQDKASANRQSLSYIEQAALDVIPASALQNVRYTGESLKQNTGTDRSGEIRSDRRTANILRNDIGAGGEVRSELSYTTYDDWFQAGFHSTWSTPITDTDIIYSTVASDNTLTRSAGSFVTDGYVVGMWLGQNGFAATENNGIFKITAVQTLKLALSYGTVSDESAGPSVTVKSSGYVTDGTTLRLFGIERENTDLSSVFSSFINMGVNTFNLAMSDKGITTVNWGWLGRRQTNAAATIGTGGNTAAPTTSPMNGVDNVRAVYDGLNEFDVVSANVRVNNNLRGRTKAGYLGAFSVGDGESAFGGEVNAYFDTNTVADKYTGFTTSTFVLAFVDDAFNYYIFDFPSVKYTDMTNSAERKNEDIFMKLSWEAFLDPTELIQARLTRIAALGV